MKYFFVVLFSLISNFSFAEGLKFNVPVEYILEVRGYNKEQNSVEEQRYRLDFDVKGALDSRNANYGTIYAIPFRVGLQAIEGKGTAVKRIEFWAGAGVTKDNGNELTVSFGGIAGERLSQSLIDKLSDVTTTEIFSLNLLAVDAKYSKQIFKVSDLPVKFVANIATKLGIPELYYGGSAGFKADEVTLLYNHYTRDSDYTKIRFRQSNTGISLGYAIRNNMNLVIYKEKEDFKLRSSSVNGQDVIPAITANPNNTKTGIKFNFKW